MKKWLERFVEYGAYLIVFLIPCLYFGGGFFTPYITSKTFIFYGLIEIIFFAWLYLILSHKWSCLNRKDWLFFAPTLLFIIWLTVSGILGINPERSFWSSLGRGTGLLTWYHILALVFVVFSLVRQIGANFINKVLFWFLNGSFVVILSVWFGDEGFNLPFVFLERSKGGGLIGNSSLAASYLIFSVFFSIFILFSETVTKRVRVWLSIILGLIVFSPLFLNLYGLLVGDFFISARAALLSLFVGIAVAFLVWLSFSSKQYIKIIGWVGLFIGLVLFLSSTSLLFVKDSYIQQKFINNATASRLIFWDIAWQGMKDRPILGWGPENYSAVYQKYFNSEILKQSSTTAEIWVDRAHNILFDIGVAGGWPAIIFYTLMILGLVTALINSFKNKNLNRAQVSILAGLVTAYFLQNLFVFDSLNSLLGLAILISIAIGGLDLNNRQNTNNNKRYLKSINTILISGISVGLVILLIFFAILPLKKTRAISDIFTAPLNQRPDRYSELLNISPVGDSWEIGGLAEEASLLYKENLDKIKKDQKLLAYSLKDLEKIIEYLGIIAKKEKDDYRLYLNLLRLNIIYASLSNNLDANFKEDLSELATYTKSLSPNHFNLIFKEVK